MFQRLPHESVRVLAAGKPLEQARVAMCMVHGRGASAADIITIATALRRPEVAYLAPEAEGNAWYPYGFMAPIEQNQPWLDDSPFDRAELCSIHIVSGMTARIDSTVNDRLRSNRACEGTRDLAER